jgi:hypothetical protein
MRSGCPSPFGNKFMKNNIKPVKELEEMFNLVVRTEKASFNRDGHLIMKIFLCKADGKNAVVAITDVPDNYDDKSMMLESIGKRMAQDSDDVLGVLMTTEAWMSVLPASKNDKPWKEKTYIRPSQDPNRKEIVIFTAQDISGNCRISTLFIERKDGKAALIEGKGDIKDITDTGGINKDSTVNFDLNLLDKFWFAYKFGVTIKNLTK